MLDVCITIDVEIWCDGWVDIDAKFDDAFRRYIYGPTPTGEVGLRFQTAILRDHGLQGVFFVEPLFSGRFGLDPLAEVVGLIRERNHEVQLHLHTEWVDEWPAPQILQTQHKRHFMRDCSREEQRILIAEGARRLLQAGGGVVNCFRAGGFGFNADTLDALADCGIAFDSSYNATAFGLDSGVAPGQVLTDIHHERGVVEFPMTVYDTGAGRLRHVQLGACSSAELEALLWSALEAGRRSFVLLSHNFELLTPTKDRADPVVVARFKRLCRFLDKHRDSFRVRGFHDLAIPEAADQPPPLRSNLLRSAWRMGEQMYRRRFA